MVEGGLEQSNQEWATCVSMRPGHGSLHVFLNECAASVHFNIGNGTIGYLVITAQPASFTIASPTAFVKQINPGVLVLAEPAPAAAVIGELTRKHTKDIHVFNEYHSVDKTCKKSPFYISTGSVFTVIQ